ncbi:mCG14829, partial [Mus musculus]
SPPPPLIAQFRPVGHEDQSLRVLESPRTHSFNVKILVATRRGHLTVSHGAPSDCSVEHPPSYRWPYPRPSWTCSTGIWKWEARKAPGTS